MTTGTYNNCTFNITISSNVQNTNSRQPKLVLVKEIPLYRKGKKIGVTIVDAKYYDELMKYKWCLFRGYALCTTHTIEHRYMHRFIMHLEGKLSAKLEVDHINREKLDNRVSNLRMVTSGNNKRNRGKLTRPDVSSNYIGVSYNKTAKRYGAKLHHNYEIIYDRYFKDEIKAAEAYDEALRQLPIDESLKVYNFPQ